jgi:hypothetical protein
MCIQGLKIQKCLFFSIPLFLLSFGIQNQKR